MESHTPGPEIAPAREIGQKAVEHRFWLSPPEESVYTEVENAVKGLDFSIEFTHHLGEPNVYSDTRVWFRRDYAKLIIRTSDNRVVFDGKSEDYLDLLYAALLALKFPDHTA